MTIHISVDAMGGDHAPAEIVAGVLQAAQKWPDTGILLVGNQDAVGPILKSLVTEVPENLAVIHAPSVITMEDTPVDAIRKKPDSSIVLSAELVRRGEAAAMVSAGNTGACVAIASLLLGLLDGVKRPGIAVPMPTPDGCAILIDAGANMSCKPAHLLQYGAMASVYYENIFGVKRPKVGLLNVGVEDAKGNELVKQTRSLFQKSTLNFIGNIEGQDIYRGNCNVVVCEGFVGNVILKATEGVAETVEILLTKSLRGLVDSQGRSQLGCDPVAIVKEKMDYAEYGGAPLLGLKGACIICHGRSRGKAICNAIRVARDIARHQVNDQIVNQVRDLPQ
ncbi:MAG: phosphate acyltransferase PlsX [Planctomycetota bacterium]|nr:phosphate acyltransferase PlsX [Planctomycetota bacterium]